MYVRSMTYEPVNGGAFADIPMFHVELVHEGQLHFEPVDLWKTLGEKSAQIGNPNNWVYFEVPDRINGEELEEILQLFGTMRDNGVGIIAESSAYYRPAWLHAVDYMIAACGDEQPLPYACNELRYYPEGDSLIHVAGHPKAVHALVLWKKYPSNDVMQFISKTGYRLITPKLFRYKVVFMQEKEEDNENTSEEDRSVSDNSGAVRFSNDPFYIPKNE